MGTSKLREGRLKDGELGGKLIDMDFLNERAMRLILLL